MNVTVDAPLYDPSLIAGGGCDPAGCVGDFTRVSQVGCTQNKSTPSMRIMLKRPAAFIQ